MQRKPSEKERLLHIIEAINRIFKFTDDLTIEQFYQHEMAQFAIIKNFEIIGEAAYRLPKDLREKYETIEWRKIMAFRHILVHEYYRIDVAVIWKTIQNKLTDLKIQIEEVLSDLEKMPK